MGVKGLKNETGAGRTEMSIFSYSAPKNDPNKGDPVYKQPMKTGGTTTPINRLVHKKCYFLSQAVVL